MSWHRGRAFGPAGWAWLLLLALLVGFAFQGTPGPVRDHGGPLRGERPRDGGRRQLPGAHPLRAAPLDEAAPHLLDDRRRASSVAGRQRLGRAARERRRLLPHRPPRRRPRQPRSGTGAPASSPAWSTRPPSFPSSARHGLHGHAPDAGGDPGGLAYVRAWRARAPAAERAWVRGMWIGFGARLLHQGAPRRSSPCSRCSSSDGCARAARPPRRPARAPALLGGPLVVPAWWCCATPGCSATSSATRWWAASLTNEFGRNPEWYKPFVIYLPVLLFGLGPGWSTPVRVPAPRTAPAPAPLAANSAQRQRRARSCCSGSCCRC